MDQEEKSGVDKLQEALYSREREPIVNEHKRTLKPDRPVAPTENWVHDDPKFHEEIKKAMDVDARSHPFFRKFLQASLGFFIVAVSAAAFIFLVGSNAVSSKNVDISVVGPLSVTGGEVLPLNIVVSNRNNTDLESASLLVEYPAGTRSATDLNRELLRDSVSLGDITSGGNVTQEFSAVLFGEKLSVQTITITVEYKIKGSNAVFSKKKLYEVSITSSPVIMSVDYSKEINSGDVATFSINVTSNSSAPIDKLLVAVDYPFGFVFASSSPQANSNQNSWTLVNIKPAETKTIILKGRLIGDTNEERTFVFRVGIPESKNNQLLGAIFVSSLETLTIKQPFIGLSVDVNGKKINPFVSKIGDQISVRIVAKNNLPVSILNGNIEVKVAGLALDRTSVAPDRSGFYRSVDDVIVWNKNSNAMLKELGPGESVAVSFRVKSLSATAAVLLRKPVMNFEISVSGQRLIPDSDPETITSRASQEVKISTNLAFTPQTARSIGSFENTGPIPPVAEQVSTYNIIWSLSNTYNDARNVEVKAKLPEYVSWGGLKSPTQEKFIWNADTREITWVAGDVRAGVGIETAPRELIFQISVLPSLSQVGNVLNLVISPTVTALDSFTSGDLKIMGKTLTTNFEGDPTYRRNDDKVRAP